MHIFVSVSSILGETWQFCRREEDVWGIPARVSMYIRYHPQMCFHIWNRRAKIWVRVIFSSLHAMFRSMLLFIENDLLWYTICFGTRSALVHDLLWYAICFGTRSALVRDLFWYAICFGTRSALVHDLLWYTICLCHWTLVNNVTSLSNVFSSSFVQEVGLIFYRLYFNPYLNSIDGMSILFWTFTRKPCFKH